MKRQWKDYQIIILSVIIIFGLIGLCDGTTPNCVHQLNGVMYPNTLDCSTYWVCEYERPTLVQCDKDTLYDPRLKTCNWWYNVDCGETPIGTTTTAKTTTVESETPAPEPETTAPESDTTAVPETNTTAYPSVYPDCENANGQIYYPHLTDSSKYFICAGNFPVELQCPAKFLWYQKYSSCISTEMPEETCFQNEYKPHTENEQYYYQCIDDKPILSLCPANLKWNQNLLKCTGEVEVSPSYPNCINSNGQIYFPHLTDITKYYFCAGSMPVELPCPAKFQWYQVYERCVRTEIPESEEELIDCMIEKYVAHPANDQMYFECVDKKPIIVVCPLDMKWNQELLNCIRGTIYPQCINPTGQKYFPHLSDSSKYYICAGDLAIELSCPPTFFWYQEYQTCARTEFPAGEEEIIDCTSDESEFAPYAEDERIYFRCIDETPVQMVCPGNSIWNQELLKCSDEASIPNYPQCENLNGQIYFPHLTDASKYYICAGHFPIELTCPTEFLWNQNYQSCVRIEIPEDEEVPIECKSNDRTQFAPHPENNQLYYHCVDGRPVQMLCPSDLKWNQELRKCTDEPPPQNYPQCDNPSGQIYFPHLTDSMKYYICAGDFAIELSCPFGFLWVQDYQSCGKMEFSESKEETDIIDCSIEDGPQSAPHDDDEQYYYLCIVEKPVLMLCPSDLKWDNILKKCTDEVTPEPIYPQCQNPSGQIYFPHLTDSSKYYICAGDYPIELPCPAGFLWSQDHQSCARLETPAEEEQVIDCTSEDYPQSAPYAGDDQFYYLCVAERPILMLCPSDLKWDQVQQICTDEVTTEPEYPQCDNPAGQVYFPHLTDLDKYYICAGNLSIELPCPSGFLWNQNHLSCARIDNPAEEENIIDCLLDNGPQSAPHANEQFYYLCIEKRPILLICPSDLKWNQNLKTCTETIAIEPDYPQCDNADGQIFFAHLTDPNKYYICAGTIPLELQCPLNYSWHQDYQSCIEDETPNEEYPLLCDNTNNADYMSLPTQSQKYFVCVDRRPAKIHCPPDATWDDKTAKCLVEIEPSYPPCGTGQIFYPHLTEENQYYLCSGDFPVPMSCPQDYIWSTDVNSCVKNDPISEEPDCSKAEGKTYLPHLTNPQKYYICLGNTALEMECPSDSLWHSTLDRCEAVQQQPIYPDCGSTQMFFPHLIDIEKYYICISGEPLLMTCIDDHIWDTEFNSCVLNKKISTPLITDTPEPICTEPGTFLSHPSDVTKYFACIGSPPITIPFSCIEDTFWMPSLQRCDSPNVIDLPNIPSVAFPEPDCANGEEFLTNYQDCHKYYICVGGILPIEFTCEKDKYWDPIDRRCIDGKSNCFKH